MLAPPAAFVTQFPANAVGWRLGPICGFLAPSANPLVCSSIPITPSPLTLPSNPVLIAGECAHQLLLCPQLWPWVWQL